MEKTTEWVLGQPLRFPTKLKSNEANRVGREVLDPAIGEPLTNGLKDRMGVDDIIPSPIAPHFCRSKNRQSGRGMPN